MLNEMVILFQTESVFIFNKILVRIYYQFLKRDRFISRTIHYSRDVHVCDPDR